MALQLRSRGIAARMALHCTVAGVALACPRLADAQVASDLTTQAHSNFSRDRNISVLERPRPFYDPEGLPLGGFLLYPSLTTTLIYDDNIYAQPSARVAAAIVDIRPDVRLASNWGRNDLSFDANTTLHRYQSHTPEDTTDWQVSGRAAAEFASRGRLEANVSSGQYTEPRYAPNTLAQQARPVTYDLSAVGAAVSQERNRFKFGMGATFQRFDYNNVPAIGGGEVVETFRNREIGLITVRMDYAYSPNLALFGELLGNVRNFEHHDPITLQNQDAAGYELLTGANFQLTHLMKGELGVGYLNESYSSAAYRQVSGLGYRGKITYFPTTLTNIVASLSRSVEDSGVTSANTYRLDAAMVEIDHELLRNLILSAKISYNHSEYIGVHRHDDFTNAGLNADYLFSRHWRFRAAYTHLTQRSGGLAAGTPFDDNRISLAIVWQD